MVTLPARLPYKRCAISEVRAALNGATLEQLQHAIVLERHGKSVAVIVPDAWYSAAVQLIEATLRQQPR